ncbi:SDR family NAD(P)-dependent oxidoreductase [Companilactobacillus kimchiensis]|uniref:Short-chain type dehydrogenase n=1 Tax=Companilactobacillus kimchiensis TaxID=993692 RepID=A0A0R2LC36_9LACO|nr:SDR family NAD(P)-dependent oxidoreductase [Companilactobacillus kimchiensis]KRN99449.1 short-chain type dehydrogenase [Companilactobacillus kimchiensis]
MTKTAIITGISSGMGHAAALYFKENGFEVYGGARRMNMMQDLAEAGIHVQELDLTDKISIRQLVDRTVKEAGQVDVLINNAGYGEFGPIEEVPTEKARRQFEVNLFGANEITQLVLPVMRRQGFGRIVNISSIGGDLYMPLGGWYHATKAGLDMWSDVLDMEVKQFGIRSVVVQPGGTDTEWGSIAMETAKKNLEENSPYTKLVDKISGSLDSASNSRMAGASAEDLAKLFYRAATDIKPKRRYFNSVGDHAAVIFSRTMPNAYRALVSRFI